MKHLALFALLLLTACGPRNQNIGPTAQSLDDVLAATSSAALTQTNLVAGVPVEQVMPTVTPVQVQAAAVPGEYSYSGRTQSCVCTNCVCLSNDELTAKVTLDAAGHITGGFVQSLPDLPALTFEGTRAEIRGLLDVGSGVAPGVQKEKAEVVGHFSANMGSFEGEMRLSGRFKVDSRNVNSGKDFYATITFVLFRS